MTSRQPTVGVSQRIINFLSLPQLGQAGRRPSLLARILFDWPNPTYGWPLSRNKPMVVITICVQCASTETAMIHIEYLPCCFDIYFAFTV
jgi:hypothetical protein